MKHHYLISYDDIGRIWELEHELEADLFDGKTLLEEHSQTWHRGYLGDDEFAPNAFEADLVIGAAIQELNEPSQKWLLALHEVARLLAQDPDEHTDNHCLDDVWQHLESLGINPNNYRPKPDRARVAVAYLGCGNECGHEQEFHGTIDEDDTAHFACPNCVTWFEHSEWSSFFEDENEVDE